jgi:hypothetical protein
MRGRARGFPVLVQRAVADSPRWTRAVGDPRCHSEQIEIGVVRGKAAVRHETVPSTILFLIPESAYSVQACCARAPGLDSPGKVARIL